MSGKDQADWEARLDADPALRTAWDAFMAQLGKDAALIKQDVQPDGHALHKAARLVFEAAGVDPEYPASD